MSEEEVRAVLPYAIPEEVRAVLPYAIPEEVRAAPHAISCKVVNCQYPSCTDVKNIFDHAENCLLGYPHVSLACIMWNIISRHAISFCKDPLCQEPYCRVIQAQLERLKPASAA